MKRMTKERKKRKETNQKTMQGTLQKPIELKIIHELKYLENITECFSSPSSRS